MAFAIRDNKETKHQKDILAETMPLVTAAPSTNKLELIRPGEPGFETYRHSMNQIFDRHPAVIARCHTAQQVSQAVRMAGYSTIDGGMLIDLSPMKSLTIDPVKKVAVAEPGLTWGEYNAQTAPYGLTTPAGDTASVGVGGLALGGGIGWVVRKYGLTIDHVISA